MLHWWKWFFNTSIFIWFAFMLYYFKFFNIISILTSDSVLFITLTTSRTEKSGVCQEKLHWIPQSISTANMFGLVPYRIYPISSWWPWALCCHLHLHFSTQLHFQSRIPAENTQPSSYCLSLQASGLFPTWKFKFTNLSCAFSLPCHTFCTTMLFQQSRGRF